MSFNRIPDCILYIIMEYIPDNKGSLSMTLSCKYLKNLFYKYGYLKYITIGPLINNLYNLSINSCQHIRTLNMISVTYSCNPHYWIFEWPKTVFFNYCTFKDKINPPSLTKTETLYILNTKNTITKVNWEKFKNLKRLELSDWNIDFEGIEVCKKLVNINVFKKVNMETIPESLKRLVTNNYT